MEAAVRGAFEKLGETKLALGDLKFSNPETRFVPVSQLNELRREIARIVEDKLDANLNARIDAVKAEMLPSGAKASRAVTAVGTTSVPQKFNWSIKVDRIEFLDSFNTDDWQNIDEVIVDVTRDHIALLSEKLEKLATQIGRERIRLALPALTRKWEEKGLLQKLEKLRAAGWNKWEAANASAWSFLNFGLQIADCGLNGNDHQSAIEPHPSPRVPFGHVGPLPQGARGIALATDWSVYVINRAAALQVIDMGAERFALSPEDGLDNMRSLLQEFGPRAVVIVHQDTPLFLAESCAYANLIGGCPGKANCSFESMDMISSYGEKVTALDYHCRTIVLNKGPFCLAPYLKELAKAGAVSLRADFIYRKYTPDAVRESWRLLRAGKNVPLGHAANFERGLQ
jgi:U32 family peptidase